MRRTRTIGSFLGLDLEAWLLVALVGSVLWSGVATLLT